MPTYEYECETCGIHFERTQRITDEPLKQCPECEGPVHRVLFPVGIVFKGSGFYCTDHRSGSSSSIVAPKEKGDEEKARPKSEEAKAEAAPEKAEKKAEAKSAD